MKKQPAAKREEIRFDHGRAARTGLPEVVFAERKTRAQVARCLRDQYAESGYAFATRVAPKDGPGLAAGLPQGRYDATARVVACGGLPRSGLRLGVVCAGTADVPVAAEAAATLEWLGHDVFERYDAGVAGIHRILEAREELERCRVVVVAAGMEGALPSVVAGLISAPVIAVPTSVGYGASFGGLAALLAMLNACAPGIAVVNIDNGFGAAALAHKIVLARLPGDGGV
jgi:NCAIR mutase (PurE)-related protein